MKMHVVVVLSTYVYFLSCLDLGFYAGGFFLYEEVSIHMSIDFFSCSVYCSPLYAFISPGGAE
jgi:hypothetical protein